MPAFYLCLVWCCLLIVGCGGAGVGEAPVPWACSEMVQLAPDSPLTPDATTYDPASQSVSLLSCLNETVSFQLILDASPSGSSNVRVSIPGLSSTTGQHIAGSQVEFYEMSAAQEKQFPAWYIRQSDQSVSPQAVYDRLSPMRSKGIDLKATERLALWVDIKVAANTAPGVYGGSITITAGQSSQRLTLRLTVYDVALPQEPAVMCLGGFSHEQIFQRFIRRSGQPYLPTVFDPAIPEVRQGLDLMRGVIRSAHAHGLDLYDATLHPLLRRSERGEPLLRWDEYDAFLKGFLDGSGFDDRQPLAAWPAPISASWPNPADYGGRDNPRYKEIVQFIARESFIHLGAMEGRERLFALTGWGALSAEAYLAQNALAREIRLVAPEMTILSELPPALPPELSALVPDYAAALMDASAPKGEFFNPAEINRKLLNQKALGGTWLRPGDMPYVGSVELEAFPVDIRSLPLAAMKYGCRGILIPEAVELVAGGGLFYISDDPANPLLPTVRLKLLRRALQDAKYIALLRRRHMEGVTQELINVLVHYCGTDAYGDSYMDCRLNGWVRRPDAYVLAHRLLAEECLAAVHPEQVSNQSLMTQRLAWQQLRQQLTAIRLEEVLSRFEQTAGGLFHGSVQVDFCNELLEPVGVVLGLLNLPAGWRSPERTYSLASIDRGQRDKIAFEITGDNVATGTNARMEAVVSLAAQGQVERPTPLGLPLLLCPQAERPITVDGDLGDWPIKAGNAASGFLLIGQRGQQGQGPTQTGLAQHQTSVFALQDEQFLYLAFRCDAPRSARCPLGQPAAGAATFDHRRGPGGGAAGPRA